MTTAKSKKITSQDVKPSSGKKASTSKGEAKEKTSKKEKVKDPELKEETAKDVAKKAIAQSTKELKYIYPEDCISGPDKKKFRTSCRAKNKTFIKTIKKMEKDKESTPADIEAKQKEYRRWKKGIYTAKPEKVEEKAS